MTTTDFAEIRSRIQSGLLARQADQIARIRWSAEQIRAEQRAGLRALLAHAIEHSPFHRRRLVGVDPETFELDQLTRLPVMTKDAMMDELEDVFTDRRLTRDAVERALAATGTEPVPILGEYHALASGGSSGRRGVYLLDLEAILAFFGSLARNLTARILAMGGPPPGGLPIAMVSAGSAVHATGAGAAATVGGALPMHFHPVPVTLPVSEIVERLNALRPPVLYGYPSMLAVLAAEQRAGRLRIAPIAITSTSESLTPELRAAIRAGFPAPIVDVFGSTEGLVGTSAPDDPVLVFNSDVCFVELVDEAYRPVPDGTPSAKVLVTNLANRLQPLIRYELTDRFVRQPDAADHGHLRAIVQGRSDEVLRFGDIDIHPLVVRGVLVKMPEVADYQVRQTRHGIELDALAAGPVDVAALREHLAAALGSAGLRDAEVSVRVVPTLDRNLQTGKLRRFIPLSS